MNDNQMRDALLKQGDVTPVDAELQALSAILQAESRRSQRLTRWTIAVWLVWMVCVTLAFVLPVWLARTQAVDGAPPEPHNAIVGVTILVSTVAMLAGAVLLPVIGVVLLVLAVSSRRSANISQLRASVAAIDAQLKALLAAKSE